MTDIYKTLFSSLCLCFTLIARTMAQDTLLDKEITLSKGTGSIEQLLKEISERGGFNFTYSNQILIAGEFTLTSQKQSVRAHLDQLFPDGKVEYYIKNQRIILRYSGGKKQNTELKYTISGYLRDAASGEALLGANVWIAELSTGASANAYGFYSLTVPQGNYTLQSSFIGYTTVTKKVQLTQDVKIDIELSSSITELETIEISDVQLEEHITSKAMSTHTLSVATIENMPSIGSNPDIIKSIQLLPGVTTIGEGSTGFFVRGGGRDQNLILLDQAPVYNPSHFLGFLSVFNTDAINHSTLYKGGIPARYGGRASSVLDVRMKEGNTKALSGEAGISLVGGAKLTLGAPIRKGKGSFMVSGRRTYAEPLFWAIGRVEPLFKGTRVFFYDVNTKANYKINDKNTVFVSGYFGQDVNKLPILDFEVNWGNQTGTVRWNHLFNNKLFSNLTFTYSRYQYKLDIPAAQIPVGWESSIRDINLSADFSYFANPGTTLDFGVSTISHRFDPGSNAFDEQFNVPNSRAWEHGLFVSLEKEIGPSLLLEAGVRWSLFQNVGETTVFEFDQSFTLSDTVRYRSGEIYNSYNNLEPRVSARYVLDKKQSIKLSYNRMAQYLHMLANSTLSFTAFDVWYPSGPTIEPLLVDQIALGYFRNLNENRVEASIEGFYKHIENQLDYADFAQLVFNPLLEGDLRSGNGWSYGVEFMLKKNTGKLRGWLSYTWSRAIHKIRGINTGRSFPALYDQPHKVVATAAYQLSEKVSLGANWTFNSGGPVTFPVESYNYDGLPAVPVYNSRNADRLPDYHRLDLSARITSKKKLFKGKVDIAYLISIYNAYARNNALALYIGEDLSAGDDFNSRTVANQVSLFSIVPAGSVLFSF
ncbi:MAG: TonB-dependent receptor [Bacteroidota bacterium]